MKRDASSEKLPMAFTLAWSRSGPTIKRPGTCESCGQPFACELSLAGCWCSKVDLTDGARVEMRTKYTNWVGYEQPHEPAGSEVSNPSTG